MIKLLNPFKRAKVNSNPKEETDADRLRAAIKEFKQTVDDIGSIDKPISDDVRNAVAFIVPLLDNWYSQIDDDLKYVIRYINVHANTSFMTVNGILETTILALKENYLKSQESNIGVDIFDTSAAAYNVLERHGVDYNVITFGEPTDDVYSSNIGCAALVVPSTPISELEGYSLIAQINIHDLKVNYELSEKGMFQFWVTPDMSQSKVVFLNSITLAQYPVEGYVQEDVIIAPEMGKTISFTNDISVSYRSYIDLGLDIINNAVKNHDADTEDVQFNSIDYTLKLASLLEITSKFERLSIKRNTRSCVFGHPWDIARKNKKSATTTLLYINTADFYPDAESNSIFTWEVPTINLYNLDTGIINGAEFTIRHY